jgi:hypothetical protein
MSSLNWLLNILIICTLNCQKDNTDPNWKETSVREIVVVQIDVSIYKVS